MIFPNARWCFSLGAAVLVLMSPAAHAQERRPAPAARPLITQRIDENNLAILRGNTRPEATPQNDAGEVSDNLAIDHMLIQLHRPVEREQALTTMIDRLHDPASPDFHRWLSAEELGRDYGPSSADTAAVTAWLQSHGFKINVVYSSAMVVDFSGTAGQVRAAFRTSMHRLNVNGEQHIANMSDPRIPAALASVVAGVVSLHDFRPRTFATPRSDYTVSTSEFAVVPADLATIYNINPVFAGGNTGAGRTVTVIEDTNLYSNSDWTIFRSTFGLDAIGPSATLATVHPAPASGTNNCANPGVLAGNAGEAILDAEWASAAAPGAAIQVAACKDTLTTFGGLIALLNLLEAPRAPEIVSISYGECEALNGATANLSYKVVYQIGVARGTSIFVSSGDEGPASCDANKKNAIHGIGVSGFASTPYNVAVGGTDFSDAYAGTSSLYWNSSNSPTYGSAISYVPEIPWNDSCAGVLLSQFVTGSPVTYGTAGFCDSKTGETNFLTTAAGSGGPSGCATGAPATSGVVGGTCAGYPKPSWQTGLPGVPSDGVRDIPDISLFAANGLWGHYYVFCYSNTASGAGGAPCTGAPSTWAGAGGTSFASPILAGIQALVNGANGGPQGNPNVVYYKLARSTPANWCLSSNGATAGSSCTFYDVTQGDIDLNCLGPNNCYKPSGIYGVLSKTDSAYSIAYGTTAAWDFATGIGSVNAANLVKNWSSAATP